MNPTLIAAAALALCGAATLASAGPPPGSGRHIGAYPGGAYRPFHPVVRPVYPAYPGWRAGYWGPRGGVYIGAPTYWGALPYGWGAAYALPYAVAPIIVNPVPPAQVLVQPPQPAPAESYWYYCTQPAGYFPYVQNCSQPWMKVVPQLPGRNDAPPQLAP
jgi:hypothetical protein